MNNIVEYKQGTYDFSKVEEKVKEVTTDLSKYDFKNLVVDEDNKKEIKALRSKFNKEFKEYEDFRKSFKKEVLKPYEEFEEVYKPLADLFKQADVDLKEGISMIENEQIKEVVESTENYFKELIKDTPLDFLKYEQANLVIKLSDSKKSRETYLETFVERVKNDVCTIDTLKHKERVRVAYDSNGLDLNNAITSVNLAIEKEEEMKRVAELKNEVNDSEIIEVVENNPKMNNVAKEFTMTFEVTAPKHELSMIKEFMVKNHIKFKGVM